jgi:hypothetical protein
MRRGVAGIGRVRAAGHTPCSVPARARAENEVSFRRSGIVRERAPIVPLVPAARNAGPEGGGRPRRLR